MLKSHSFPHTLLSLGQSHSHLQKQPAVQSAGVSLANAGRAQQEHPPSDQACKSDLITHWQIIDNQLTARTWRHNQGPTFYLAPTKLLELARFSHTAQHTRLKLQIPECSAGVLVSQSEQDQNWMTLSFPSMVNSCDCTLNCMLSPWNPIKRLQCASTST